MEHPKDEGILTIGRLKSRRLAGSCADACESQVVRRGGGSATLRSGGDIRSGCSFPLHDQGEDLHIAVSTGRYLQTPASSRNL